MGHYVMKSLLCAVIRKYEYQSSKRSEPVESQKDLEQCLYWETGA